MSQRYPPINYNVGFWLCICMLIVLIIGVATVALGAIITLCLCMDDRQARRGWNWFEWSLTLLLGSFALWMLSGLGLWIFSANPSTLFSAISVYLAASFACVMVIAALLASDIWKCETTYQSAA